MAKSFSLKAALHAWFITTDDTTEHPGLLVSALQPRSVAASMETKLHLTMLNLRPWAMVVLAAKGMTRCAQLQLLIGN